MQHSGQDTERRETKEKAEHRNLQDEQHGQIVRNK
jgi:hypothetical protein